MKSLLNSIVGKTVVKAIAHKGAYGLIGKIEFQFNDGTAIIIDGDGEDGGECGRYPGLNVSRKEK